VDHDAIPKMIEKYQALLDKMAASDMPEDAQYRVDVEKICRFRIDACMKYPDDPDKVEELCNCGQVEELVEQADDEMEVLDMYLRERWWEQLNPNVPIDINPDPEDDEKGVDLEDEEPKEAAK
jgi:NADH dehydrogenase (ubiquinone) 1 alpha subcomplex subunit 5